MEIEPGGLITPALREKLEAEFPLEAHKVVKKGGAETTHVPVWLYVDRLNEVDPTWRHEIQDLKQTESTTKDGERILKLVATVAVTINGVTRSNVGEAESSEEQYGSDATNAVAQAFKRACALFGVGRYLYDKKRAAEIARAISRGGTSRSSSSSSTSSKAKATKAQVDLIGKLLKSHVFSEKERDMVREQFKKDSSKANASKIIERTKAALEKRKQEEGDEDSALDPRLEEAVEVLDLSPSNDAARALFAE